MNPVTKDAYKGVLEKIEKEQPSFYQFLISDLKNFESHHYYHTKIFDSFRIGIETGLLPSEYKIELEVVKSIRNKFIYHELFGSWIGTENKTTKLMLDIKSPDSFKVIRSWKGVIDDETTEEIQEYHSFDNVLIESDDLFIMNLSSDERKRTILKLVLYPAIAYKKTLLGSLFIFSDSTFSCCTQAFLEKVDGNT